MRTTLLACFLLFIGQMAAFAQEDVLRPNGRGTSSPPSATEPVRTSDEQAPESRLILRGGIEAGLGLHMYGKTVEGVIATSPLTMFNEGAGLTPLYGVYAEVELTPSVALGIRMMVDEKTVNGEKSGLLQDCVIFDQNGVPVQVSVTSMKGEFTQTLTFFTLTPLVRFDIAGGLFAQIGPTIHLPAGKLQSTTTFTIDSGEDCFFDFGQPTQSKQFTANAETDNIPIIRLGLDAAIGYRFDVGNNLELVPRIGYQWMLTPLDNEETGVDLSREITDLSVRNYVARPASLHSLQVSLALWYRL